MASDDGHLDPNIRPSEASDRKEMVALILEDHTASGTTLIPILRDESGAFTDLAPLSVLDFGSGKVASPGSCLFTAKLGGSNTCQKYAPHPRHEHPARGI